MLEYTCAFSGKKIAIGHGIHVVTADSKLISAWGNKELSLIKRKISPKNVRWTEQSRSFYNKNNKQVSQESKNISVAKIERGFRFVPKSVLDAKKN